MKIIDLLNKIANGEGVPNKIKWDDIIYAYSEYDKDYLEYPFSDEEYKGLFDMRDNILTQFLNYEVEIIEEEKKIPEKLTHKEERWHDPKDENPISINVRYFYDKEEIGDKINEIIDYLKSKGE